MRRLYDLPPPSPRAAPAATTMLLNSSVTPALNLQNSLAPPRSTLYRPDSFRQYISRQTIAKPARGRELFARAIRRIIEQIRAKKQRLLEDQQLFATYEEAIGIFSDLTFMKCVLLKKKVSDSNNRAWTIEFACEGGLHALLSYLEHVTTNGLSLVDAILVNEALQCLRAMMNISELFEHIASNPQYIDSIAKVLTAPSTDIRMRVFELLTALCVYSQDGYELVLQSLQDFQATNKLPNLFVVILEQLKYSIVAKHKWSAIALLNSILSSTESIEQRLAYRNILYSNGFASILEDARADQDEDLDNELDSFLDDQKHDEAEFIEHFDQTDSQSILQAIQLQLVPESSDSALFLTAMQLLYSALTTSTADERHRILQNLIDHASHATEKKVEKKTIDNAIQTDAVPQPDVRSSPAYQEVPVASKPTPILTNNQPVEQATDALSPSVLVNTRNVINTGSPLIQPSVMQPISPSNLQNSSTIPPPPPLPINLQIPSAGVPPPPPPPFPSHLQPNSSTIPPPPPPPPGGFGGPPPPPFPSHLQPNSSTIPPPPPPPPGGFGGPPPPPPLPGAPGAPVPSASGAFGAKASVVGLSALVDSIPKPKNQLRRLQWKKLPQTILTTSLFWMEVNKKADSQINFSQIDDFFKVNKENSTTTLTTKTKAATTQILPHNRSIAINVFLKKFNFNDARSFTAALEDAQSNLNSECLRMLTKILPTGDEVSLIHDHPKDQWALPEEFIHEVASVSHYEFRVQTRILVTEFDETFSDFKRKFEAIGKIISFLQAAPSIKQLARSLLSVGDFLNYGSYAGNAFGFRLDILDQLPNIRSSENRNLLGVLLDTCPERFNFTAELKPLLANDIQFKLVKVEYVDWKKKIDDGLKQMNSLEDEQIIKQYRSFYEQSSCQLIQTLDPLLAECEKQEKELMKQFGESDLNEFNYDTCCTIFRHLIEQVEKESKEREKSLATTKVLLNSTKTLPLPQPQRDVVNPNKLVENNFMDSLMTELKHRKFATAPRARRPRRGLFDEDERDVK